MVSKLINEDCQRLRNTNYTAVIAQLHDEKQVWNRYLGKTKSYKHAHTNQRYSVFMPEDVSLSTGYVSTLTLPILSTKGQSVKRLESLLGRSMARAESAPSSDDGEVRTTTPRWTRTRNGYAALGSFQLHVEISEAARDDRRKVI